MYRLGLSVSGIEGYHHFTDIVVFNWPRNWTIENSTQQPLLLLVELAIQNQWGRGPWRKWKVETLAPTEVGKSWYGLERQEGGAHDVCIQWHTNGKNGDHLERGAKGRNLKATVRVCTKNMGSVDRSDHYCVTHAFILKFLKWWRKLFLWCLEVCIVNSYTLYSSHKAQMGVKPMSHVRYRQALVENLAGDMHSLRKRWYPGAAEREERLNKAPHFLYHHDRKKQKDIIVWSNRKVTGARKEIYFYCKTCINQSAMCPEECFER
jgi:hypothetical protein